MATATNSTSQVDSARRLTSGALWLIGGFVFCPCHLPLTVWLIGSLAAGTAFGAAVDGHVYAAGIALSLVWVLATLRGIALLRAAQARPTHRGIR